MCVTLNKLFFNSHIMYEICLTLNILCIRNMKRKSLLASIMNINYDLN